MAVLIDEVALQVEPERAAAADEPAAPRPAARLPVMPLLRREMRRIAEREARLAAN